VHIRAHPQNQHIDRQIRRNLLRERARAADVGAMDATVHGLFRLFGAQARSCAWARNAGLNLTERLPVIKNLLIRQAMA